MTQIAIEKVSSKYEITVPVKVHTVGSDGRVTLLIDGHSSEMMRPGDERSFTFAIEVNHL